MGFLFAQWIRDGGALPHIEELVEEGTAITYLHQGDQILLSPKDQIKEDLGRSPDLWDAYAQTFAEPVVKADPMSPYNRAVNNSGYNPMEREYGHRTGNQDNHDYNPL